MFTATTTITRPATSIPWFSDTLDGAILVSMNSDPLVTGQTITGADSLTRVSSLTFNSYDDYQSWITKVTETNNTLWIKRNDYVVANSMTLKVEEIVDGGAPVIEKMI